MGIVSSALFMILPVLVILDFSIWSKFILFHGRKKVHPHVAIMGALPVSLFCELTKPKFLGIFQN